MTQLVIDNVAVDVSIKKIGATLMRKEILKFVKREGKLVQVRRRRSYLNKRAGIPPSITKFAEMNILMDKIELLPKMIKECKPTEIKKRAQMEIDLETAKQQKESFDDFKLEYARLGKATEIFNNALKQGREAESTLLLHEIPPEDASMVRAFADVDFLGTSQDVTYSSEYVDPQTGMPVDPQELITKVMNEQGELVDHPFFERTKIIKPKLKLNRVELQKYKIENYYELFIRAKSYNEREQLRMSTMLYAKTEEWIANENIGMCQYVFRKGETAWVAFVFPLIREVDGEFKYVWILATTDTKLHYEKMMAVPATPEVEVHKDAEINLEAFTS